MTTRVLLADDHTLMRQGIVTLLREIEGVEVVGEAADGLEALKKVKELRPHLVVTDIAMPRLNGLELTARLAETEPEVRVVILSMHLDDEYVREALRAGAAGYILKDADSGELERAVRAAASGHTYLCPQVSTLVAADYQRLVQREAEETSSLSPRQREVLKMIAEGETTKSIARGLGVSVKTVEGHRALLMERLGIRDVAGLVRHAIKIRLVDPG